MGGFWTEQQQFNKWHDAFWSITFMDILVLCPSSGNWELIIVTNIIAQGIAIKKINDFSNEIPWVQISNW